MSTKFEKLIAKHELIKRGVDTSIVHAERIRQMSDDELKEILAEPDEDEIND